MPHSASAWERCGLAGVLASLALMLLATTVVSIFCYAMFDSPGRPVLVVLASLCLAAAATGAALQRTGPLYLLVRHLPRTLDGSFRRRPVVGSLVVLSMVLSLVQVGRLCCFMADPSLRWGSAYPPVEEGVKHMCMASYLQAAELNRGGHPNVYAEEHYPAFGSQAFGAAKVDDFPIEHIEPYIDDAYEYPPQFLVLPRLALALSNDYRIHRVGWFGLQALAFLAVALAVARHVGGRRALVFALLVPTMLSSLPFLFNFQFGQFHLAAILLAVSGMLAFEHGRNGVGGALLALSIVTKIFPGLLIVSLLVKRRWYAVAWTAGLSAVYTLIAWGVVGTDAYVAFVEYHLPRIASGEAFRFFTKSYLTVAANYGVYGIPYKFHWLGLFAMSDASALEMGSRLSWFYGLIVVAGTVWVARRRSARQQDPIYWFALLSLASLRSPLAPNVYVGAPALCLLGLLASDARGRALPVVLIVLAWLTIGGLPPLPGQNATIVLWMTGQVAMLALGFWALGRPRGFSTPGL